MKGFVYVIESPTSNDLLDGRTEGRALTEALALARIPSWYGLVTDQDTMHSAIRQRLSEAWKHWQLPPVLHLSMHGSQDGVDLTNGSFLSWHDLRGLLLPLNRAMQGGLLICMSTCFGSSGCRMAMYEDSEPTFWALVGNAGASLWADAAVAYITFYHLFFKGVPVVTCVNAMCVASADTNFVLHSGRDTKDDWLAYMQDKGEGLSQRISLATKGTS